MSDKHRMKRILVIDTLYGHLEDDFKVSKYEKNKTVYFKSDLKKSNYPSSSFTHNFKS